MEPGTWNLEPGTILKILDISFAVFHTALIVFNLTGWAFRKTRRIHLAVISLTILSWFGLGYFYGFGYCPCTDWHWDVKLALGERGLPASWVKYYVDWLTGKDWDASLIDTAVGAFGFSALIVSIIVNWRDRRKSSRNPAGGLEAGSPPARG